MWDNWGDEVHPAGCSVSQVKREQGSLSNQTEAFIFWFGCGHDLRNRESWDLWPELTSSAVLQERKQTGIACAGVVVTACYSWFTLTCHITEEAWCCPWSTDTVITQRYNVVKSFPVLDIFLGQSVDMSPKRLMNGQCKVSWSASILCNSQIIFC